MSQSYITTPKNIREEFPFLQNRDAWLYLDNAATTQKPLEVIEAVRDHYVKGSANIHRGSYIYARRSEEEVEGVRLQLQKFIGASSAEEIIFTSGTTESLNIVAESYGEIGVEEGDEVIVSVMAHHSLFLPWKRLCDRKKAHLRILPITEKGKVDLVALKKIISSRTKVVAVNYVSNVLGTINPISEICLLAHAKDAVVIVDAAQAVTHLKIDVEALNCDFLAFSGHKMYGPTGIGVLYGKASILKKMVPYQLGGGMITNLSSIDKPLYEVPPYRFEAGTLHLAGIIGLGAALRFIEKIGYTALYNHSKNLLHYLYKSLNGLPAIQWLGENIVPEVGIATFQIEGVHSLDVAFYLDASHIALRTGHFCAKPLMDYLKVEGGIRVSLAIYNREEEIDRLCVELTKIIKGLRS